MRKAISYWLIRVAISVSPTSRWRSRLSPSMEESRRRAMVDRLGVHRADETQAIHPPGRVRQQFAQPRLGLAVAGEAKLARRDGETGLRRRHAGQPLTLPHRVGQFLA